MKARLKVLFSDPKIASVTALFLSYLAGQVIGQAVAAAGERLEYMYDELERVTALVDARNSQLVSGDAAASNEPGTPVVREFLIGNVED